MQAQTQVRELMGMSVTDTNGTKVGTIKQVYLNDDSGSPEWVTVHTGWFGMRESFVPLAGTRRNQDALQVPYDKETIKGAPNVDADEHLSHAQIVDLYRHYGVRPPGGRRTGEQGPRQEAGEGRQAAGDEAGTPQAGDAADTAGTAGTTGTAPGEAGTQGTAGKAAAAAGTAGMAVRPEKTGRERQAMPPQPEREGAEAPMTEITRSEEQLRIGTERHESGRVRVHKWVETEMVERTIPVSHEEIRIDREPITGGEPSSAVSLSADEQEIILYEERPVVTKETIPVERIRIRTDQVQDEQTVRGEIRKERIEVTREEIPREGEAGGADTGTGGGERNRPSG
ncbi:PRC and DUF2382 domain-containing protein [Actinomadura sp. 6K520]|uniref:DUF2382 domain-containing protein n=1 Tax=Actinomadura sp. 6K520 TaxID=2530364 RepID=UPI0010486748|nr:PRC and DUF2382 domain-containing protein [Actinomadura sp. 6K520]TDE27134.1 DUF2382 domain-containing protein [Actinomadura sp. 6K520]